MFIKPKSKAASAAAAPTLVDQETLKEPDFVPPEQIAKEEELVERTDAMVKSSGTNKPSFWQKFSKKKKILIITVVSLLVLGSAAAGFLLTRKKPVQTKPTLAPVVQKVEEPAKPTTEASKLTGIQISPELNKRGVTAVMIENSIDARPQSGLLDAGVVYEAIAEGGITRFVALYQEAMPDYIGPVRSARPYYIEWMLPYNATYMHIGGSGAALQMISQLGVKDMGELGGDNPIQRVSNRYAPHNAYTSMAKLDIVRNNRKWGNPDFSGFARKAEAASKSPNATAIDLKISSTNFYVHYDYVAASNSYLRSEGGAPHKDERSGKQLNPKVVVAMVVPYGINSDGIHSDYATTGSGQAYIFQDGDVAIGTWSKASQTAQLTFKDAAGNVLGLNPGQTWITAVGQSSMVGYTFPAPPATKVGQ